MSALSCPVHRVVDSVPLCELKNRLKAHPIVPVRGCREKVRKPMRGDEYVGRESSQRGLSRSPVGNSYKVSVHGRTVVIRRFAEEIRTDAEL